MEEKELIAKLKDPDTKSFAFDRMVRTHQQMLYYHIRRLVKTHDDTDDVLQNVFLKAWKNLDKFRGDASLKTWLYRIATNESLTHLNKQKKRVFQDLVNIEDNLSHSRAIGADPDGDQIQAKLEQAVESLPEKQKLVFNMRYYDEMKYDDIASVLNTSVGGLKASYHHAVKKIEKYITTN